MPFDYWILKDILDLEFARMDNTNSTFAPFDRL